MDIALSVVIPCYNEGENVTQVVHAARQALENGPEPSWELVVVDDGSADSTGDVMHRLVAEDPRIRPLRHEKNRGLGAALRTGFAACRGEIITWVPGDGQYDLANVLEGLAQMQPGGQTAPMDIVVALRRGRKERSRSYISLCFHGMIRLLFQFEATDMCGIYLVRRSVLTEIAPRSNDIFLNLEIPLACVKRGKSLGTISLDILPRLSGASKVANTKTMVRNVVEMFRYRCGI